VFAGADRLYLFPVAATAREVVRLARDAGISRIVVLSSGAVTAGVDGGFHLDVERAVEASGLPWTFLRPGEFMLNKVWLWGPTIRSERVVYEPFPDMAWCPVHECDIADVAVTVLRDRSGDHLQRAYDLNGPAFVSRRDQVRAIADALGEHVRLEVVSRHDARERYRRQGGFAAANADFLLGFENYAGSKTDPPRREPTRADPAETTTAEATMPTKTKGRPTAEPITGRPARTFAEWARDHVADFR
jgi:uncharacterized protein YbjT (DUF2867 family)